MPIKGAIGGGDRGKGVHRNKSGGPNVRGENQIPPPELLIQNILLLGQGRIQGAGDIRPPNRFREGRSPPPEFGIFNVPIFRIASQ